MEKIIDLFNDNTMRVEKIRSFGEISPPDFWYCQEENEFVYIVDGNARLTLFDGKEITLSKGDNYYIEKFVKHRVSFTSNDCIWLCVFTKGD